VEDGLAVGADERDALRGDVEAAAGVERGAGEEFAEKEVELAEAASGGGATLSKMEESGANIAGEGERGVVQELCVDAWRVAPSASLRASSDAGEGDVDAVGGSAGHEAED